MYELHTYIANIHMYVINRLFNTHECALHNCNLHIYTHVNDFYRPGQWSYIAIVVTVTIYYIANIQ